MTGMVVIIVAMWSLLIYGYSEVGGAAMGLLL